MEFDNNISGCALQPSFNISKGAERCSNISTVSMFALSEIKDDLLSMSTATSKLLTSENFMRSQNFCTLSCNNTFTCIICVRVLISGSYVWAEQRHFEKMIVLVRLHILSCPGTIYNLSLPSQTIKQSWYPLHQTARSVLLFNDITSPSPSHLRFSYPSPLLSQALPNGLARRSWAIYPKHYRALFEESHRLCSSSLTLQLLLGLPSACSTLKPLIQGK